MPDLRSLTSFDFTTLNTMQHEEPVLSKLVAAGDEVTLALLEIDSKNFSNDGDRDLARRAVFADVMVKHGLPSAHETMLCHEISALVANRPIMMSLFDYYELKRCASLG
jgi:hypothetical protein